MAVSTSRSAVLRRPSYLLLPLLLSPPGTARPGLRPQSSGPPAMQPSPPAAPHWLSGLRFDNRALRALPVEEPPPGGDSAPRPVPGACFSRVRPSPLRQPRLVAFSAPALALLGLDPPPPLGAGPDQEEPEEAGETPSRRVSSAEAELELYFSGNALLPGSEPAAHCYCGHQFGSFAGQLGDGAAVYLGEVLGAAGQRWELQLKGAGLTPFSRFGSFEIFKPPDEHTGRKGPSVGRNDIRVQMLDYVIGSFYPEIQAAHARDSMQRNLAFFREITRRTARLVADWQCVGFCHGVLNTDNMSIVGLTIDYGPFGFMDRYDPDHVCNSSDTTGRYAYSKQPEVCKWNLRKLAEALVPELPLELSEPVLEEYDAEFDKRYLHKMRQKLGLVQLQLEEDRELAAALLETMRLTGADFTNTFCLLSSFSVALEPAREAHFMDRLAQQCASLEELKLAFRPQMDPRQLSMMLMLAQSNPQLFALIGTKASVTRELERIEQASKLQELSPAELIRRNREHWDAWLQTYRARLERDRQSAGSASGWDTERVRVMRANNPRIVLRNYIAQNAIEAAEQGDFSEVRPAKPRGGGCPGLLPACGHAHVCACSPGAAGAEAAGEAVRGAVGGRRRWAPGGRGRSRQRGGREPPVLRPEAAPVGRRAVCDVIFVAALGCFSLQPGRVSEAPAGAAESPKQSVWGLPDGCFSMKAEMSSRLRPVSVRR
uniref:Selenoprotein O n=1 Tax=Monodelphis domestica TaxID=13616 RepID=A0A5F8GZG3_MONDO